MARINYRATEDYRSAYQPYGTWRERVGRLPSRDSVDAWVRVFSEAHHFRLGCRAHGKCLAGADEAPWICTICCARGRSGRGRLHHDGEARASRVVGNSHQLPWDHSIRHCKGAPVRRSRAIRALTRRKTRISAAHGLIREATCVRTNDGDSPPNAVRTGGLARLPGSLAV